MVLNPSPCHRPTRVLTGVTGGWVATSGVYLDPPDKDVGNPSRVRILSVGAEHPTTGCRWTLPVASSETVGES